MKLPLVPKLLERRFCRCCQNQLPSKKRRLGATARRRPRYRQNHRKSPLDRRTGLGRVDATKGHYDDALAKGNIVHLLATESTGALSPDVIRLLRELAKTAQGTSGHDSTVYGLSRASPKSFFPHHLAAISSAIVCADARSIRNHAASLATQLSHGMI